jgi:hypothetical protein
MVMRQYCNRLELIEIIIGWHNKEGIICLVDPNDTCE